MLPKKVFLSLPIVVARPKQQPKRVKKAISRASPIGDYDYCEYGDIINIAVSESWREHRQKVVWSGIKRIAQTDLGLYLKVSRHANKAPQLFLKEELAKLNELGISSIDGEIDDFTRALIQDATDPNRRVVSYY